MATNNSRSNDMGLLDGGRTDRLRHRCSHHSGCNIDVSPFVAGANSHPKTDRQTDRRAYTCDRSK